MSTYDYIVIDEQFYSSGSGHRLQFAALQMQPISEVAKTIDRTIGGAKTVTYGGVYPAISYTLKLPYSTSGSAWGTFWNFKEIFERNNPASGILPRFVLTDNWGHSYANCFIENTKVGIDPITTIIEGDEQWSTVSVTIALGDRI